MPAPHLTAEPLYERYNDHRGEVGGRHARGIPWPAMTPEQREKWVAFALYILDLDRPACTGDDLYGLAQRSSHPSVIGTDHDTRDWWPNWDTLTVQHRVVWAKLAMEIYPPQPFTPGELRALFDNYAAQGLNVLECWHNVTVAVNDRIVDPLTQQGV